MIYRHQSWPFLPKCPLAQLLQVFPDVACPHLKELMLSLEPNATEAVYHSGLELADISLGYGGFVSCDVTGDAAREIKQTTMRSGEEMRL